MAQKKPINQYFATCPRGLEKLLGRELQKSGATAIQPIGGGVSFKGDLSVCYHANLHSRLATRILIQVGRGTYNNEDELYQGAYKINWQNWFDVKHDFMVKVTGVKCPLKSLEFATLKIKDAVCDKFRQKVGERPYIDTRNPAVRVHAYLAKNDYQLYVDTSGAPLYQRGNRRHSVEAPLRENLAAGILKLSGWQPGQPLLDPMCGSGTFVLEAAMVALNRAPGMSRNFGFEKLKNYEADTWKKLKNTAQKAAKPVSFQQIYANDIDLRAVRVTKKNLAEADLLDAVTITQQPFAELTKPAETGVMVANPPYGVRLGEDEMLAELYPQMGATLKQQFAGWDTYFLTSDLQMPKGMRLSPSKKTPLFNGALECRLFEIKMVAGSNRKPKKPNSNSTERAKPKTATKLSFRDVKDID